MKLISWNNIVVNLYELKDRLLEENSEDYDKVVDFPRILKENYESGCLSLSVPTRDIGFDLGKHRELVYSLCMFEPWMNLPSDDICSLEGRASFVSKMYENCYSAPGIEDIEELEEYCDEHGICNAFMVQGDSVYYMATGDLSLVGTLYEGGKIPSNVEVSYVSGDYMYLTEYV